MATVEARITKVEKDESSGWYRISTDDGEVKRLDTKIAEKAKEAAALKGVLAQIEFTERQGNPNPHAPGTYYLNRYYERAGSVEVAQDDGIDIVQQTSRKTDPEDAWRMCLNKGGELAVRTLPLMGENQRSFEVQKQIALAWAMFFLFTPMPSLEQLTFGGGNGFGAGNSTDNPPPHSDEDIPF